MHLKILGLQGSKNIELIATAVSKMGIESTKAALAASGLSEKEMVLILANKGIAETEVASTAATIAHSRANVAATATTAGLTGATKSLGVALKGLGTAFISNPLMWVAAGIAAISLVTQGYKKYQESLREAAEAAHEQTEKTKGYVESLEELQQRIDSGTESSDTLTEAFREQLKTMGYTKAEIDSLIGKYENLSDAIDEVTKKEKQQAISDAGAELDAQEKAARTEYDNAAIWGKGQLILDDGYIHWWEKRENIGTKSSPEYEISDAFKFYSDEIKEDLIKNTEELDKAWRKAFSDKNRHMEYIVPYYDKLKEQYEVLKEAATFDKGIYDSSYYKEIGAQIQYIEKEFNSYISSYKSYRELISFSEDDIPKNVGFKIFGSIQEETKKQAETLKSAFSEIFTNDDKDSAFKTSVDTYIDKVTELKSALEKLRKEELDSKDITKLFEDFPALAYQADNLDAAIVNLISDLKADIGDDVSQQLKNMATDEDRAALEAYGIELSNLASIADYASIRVEHLTSTIDKVEKGKSVLKSATDEMRENGEISQNTLKSIMELVDEGENWVDYIKLENGQLKLNVDLWQEKIKDSLKLELTNFENELAILRKENDEIVKQIALFKTRKSVLAQETAATEQNNKLFMPSLLDKKRNGSLPDNINPNMLWSPLDEKLQKNIDDQKILNDSIEAIKALMDSYDKEFESIISGTDSDSKSSKSSDPKQYNWIETVIDRIKRKINSFANTVSSKFNTFSQRNNAAKEEISAITKEIELQQKAYEKYIKLADSVKLSESIKEKVRNGAIDISEYSEETAELIDKYKEWYEASLNAKDAIDELHESLASLYDDEFARIETEFKNRISLISYLSNMYNTGMDALEAKGYIASTEFYKALSNVSERNISVLKDELSSLESAMQRALNSGEIEKYSEAWLNYQPHYLATSKHNNLFNCWNTLRAMRTTA